MKSSLDSGRVRVRHEVAASVITDDRSGKLGRVAPIRWNPLEGSSNAPAQVITRGNCDYQCMLRTFTAGFGSHHERDELRDEPLPEGEVERRQMKALNDEFTEKGEEIINSRRERGLKPYTKKELTEHLEQSYQARLRQLKRGQRIGDRLVDAQTRRIEMWVRKLVVDMMASSIAATFYACDYSTKPNMTCAPLLVAIRECIAKLEEQLEVEREEQKRTEEALAKMTDPNSTQASPSQSQAPQAQQQETKSQQTRRPMSKLQQEAARRLIRQAKAANQAQVKGNCLMIMQMLTGREVLRTHYPWQLMTKHPVFMAMEHRRRLAGFEERRPNRTVPISLVQAAEESDSTGENSEAESTKFDPTNGNDEARHESEADASVDAEDEEVEPGPADAAVGLPEEEKLVPADGAVVLPEKTSTRCRLRNDTFYDDYLHRGSREFVEGFGSIETPLCRMSLYEYAKFVRITHGDAWSLKRNQYAFEAHHAKFDTFVQELRPSPVPPHIHGFTMPTVERDPETNALFKQLLLRPHRCKGPKHCLGYDVTSPFCDCRKERRRVVDEDGVAITDLDGREIFERRQVYSYTRQWRFFEARQAALALKADEKIHKAERVPVLQDVDACRGWWFSGAQRGGEIHTDLAPMLIRSYHRQRKKEDVKVWEQRLPTNIVWVILRFAGNFRDAAGNVVCVANKKSEIGELRKVFGMDVTFTSPGVHDEQLTAEEYFAWWRIECATRLESMAEARHRPRPGNVHPDAIPDDPDGVQGGLAAEDARFDRDNGLPGANSSDSDDFAAKRSCLEDSDIIYVPKKQAVITADKFWDVLHRWDQLKNQSENTSATKHKVPKKFYKDHEHIYKNLEKPMAVAASAGNGRSTEDVAADGKTAFRNQQRIIEKKSCEADADARIRQFAVRQQVQPDTDVDEA